VSGHLFASAALPPGNGAVGEMEGEWMGQTQSRSGRGDEKEILPPAGNEPRLSTS
jgi:hypothetical protein